ncbi:MAG TPA: hypothetical protein VF894_16290, partial [Anaeromyxobacter sp.]
MTPLRVATLLAVLMTSSHPARAGARAAPPGDALAGIPAERRTTWDPGIRGGVPPRTKVCATIPAD